MNHVGIAYEREKQIAVMYRDELLCYQRLDIVVADQIVLELKAVERLNPVHHAQLISYLRISNRPVGLLMNFNVVVLKDGLKRVAV